MKQRFFVKSCVQTVFLAFLLASSACQSKSAAQASAEDLDGSQAWFGDSGVGDGDEYGGGYGVYGCTAPYETTPTVDGLFTGWKDGTWTVANHEYSAVAPVQGKFGWFYAAVPDCNSFYLLNDWYVRNDAPICPAMYNLFRFSTGDGHQHWEVRVFGDGGISIRLNDVVFAGGTGGFSFSPSPNSTIPHTIFEFGVTGVDPGKFACQLHDPASAASLLVADPGPTPGCGNPDAALLLEPTILTATIQPGTQPELRPATTPTAVILVPSSAVAGQEVTIHGGLFGSVQGSVTVGDVPQQLVSWSDAEIHFQLTGGLSGVQRVLVNTPTGTANDLWLKLPGPNACDDGIPCTTDASDAKGCSHTPVNAACSDGDSCTQDLCLATGCAFPPLATPGCPCASPGGPWCPCAGAADCDSGNGGGCEPGPTGKLCATSCDAKMCPVGWSCETSSGSAAPTCVWQCTKQPETCNGIDDDCDGIVDNTANCDDGNPCTIDTCDPKTLGCNHNVIALGNACDDGNACTHSDKCQAGGACMGSETSGPSPTTSCYVNVCNPATGGFASQPAIGAEGTPCDGGDACTAGSTCSAGNCSGGTTVICDDQSVCTDDACDPVLGCTFKPVVIPAGTTVTCDDGDLCSENDACSAGKCQGTSVTASLQLLPCQSVSCDASTGQLTFTLAPVGHPCDDGNALTSCDICKADGSCAGSIEGCQ